MVRTGFAATRRLLAADVASVTGRSWRLVRHLGGGYQSGAWLVRDGQRQAVLKWGAWPWWAPRVIAAEGLVRRAREQGYPTPQWLAAATTAAGYPWQLAAVVPGRYPRRLDPRLATQIIELTDAQRTIRLPGAGNWSQYMYDTALTDPEGKHRRLHDAGPATAAAVADAVRLATPHAQCPLPDGEMVHGDLNIANLICRNGRLAGVIDIEAIGAGTAVYDLLTPARQARLWGEDTTAASLLERHAIRNYPAAAIAVAAAAQVIDILTFGLRRWAPTHLQDIATAASRWTRHLHTLLDE